MIVIKKVQFGILLIWALLLSFSSYAQLPTLYQNSFMGQDISGLVFGGETGHNAPRIPTPAYLTATNGDDPDGDGYLRLTNNVNWRTGYAYVKKSFPSQNGIKAEFEFFIWGGDQADGITFFLFDAHKPFLEGKYGGALGYAQFGDNNTGTWDPGVNPRFGPGMNGGFLGVGIDEHGNYGINSEGKSGGIQRDGNPTWYSHIQTNGGGVIAIRGAVDPADPNGDGGRTGANAYPFIDGKVTAPMASGATNIPVSSAFLPPADQFSLATGSRGVDDSHPNYRKIFIDIQKNPGANSGFTINVQVMVGGAVPRMIDVLTNVQYNIADANIPSRLKAGFASSTGLNTNYHEIRHLKIEAVTDLVPLDAQNDTETGTLNTPVDINVLANDNATLNGGVFESGSVDLDPATPGIQSTYTVAGEGTYMVTPAGVVTFTPETGFTGTTTPINYTFEDNLGGESNVATITVTINTPVNTPPVANDDAVAGKKGTSVNIDVAGNDTDADGTIDPASILLIDPADNGKKTTVTIPGEGTYTVNLTTHTVDFVPDPAFTGVSTIKYTVKDDKGAESNEATISVTITDPKVSLIKSASTAPAGGFKLGDVITYTFKVKNEGDVALNTVTLTDNLTGLSTPVLTAGTDTGNDNILSVGEEWTYTATYTITQADVDAGKVTNQATVNAKDPSDIPIIPVKSDSDDPTKPGIEDPTETEIPQTPAASLLKTASAAPAGGFKQGDVITYTFVVKNEGNVTLKDISVTDPLPGLSALNRTVGTGTTLAPGAAWTYTATYTVTQADVDAGKVTNQATANAKDPLDTPIPPVKSDSDDPTKPGTDDPTETIIPQTPVVSLVKTASAAPAGGFKQGNEVTYTFVVKNEGNVTLKDISITDNLSGLSAITRTVGTGTTLAPGAEWTYTATYTITEADVLAGKVINTATVTSKDPQDGDVTDKSGTATDNDTDTEITVVPNSPVANDDNAETEYNKEVKINLVENDQPDGSPLDLSSIEIVNPPLNGTLADNGDGTVTYKPYDGFAGTDEFTYRIKDQNGNYTNTATVKVKVSGFRIPNVFTPNGDGKNDTFVIVGLDEFDNNELIVFNRWGSEVFREVNYKNTWNGAGLNEGTYYYILKLRKTGNEEVRKGWVLIKR